MILYCTILYYPPPPLQSPPLAIPPPQGRGRPSLHCFARQYLLQWFVFPICHTHVLALLSHYFKSVTCVYYVIFSLQRRCKGCCVPFSDPRCFLPVTVYGTTHEHLVHMCWPLLWGLHQMGEYKGRVHNECIRINRSVPRVVCTVSKSAKSSERTMLFSIKEGTRGLLEEASYLCTVDGAPCHMHAAICALLTPPKKIGTGSYFWPNWWR